MALTPNEGWLCFIVCLVSFVPTVRSTAAVSSYRSSIARWLGADDYDAAVDDKKQPGAALRSIRRQLDFGVLRGKI